MVSKKNWSEFRNTGLLLFINQILHVFGWAIVIEFEDDSDTIIDVYPARVKYRGFQEKLVSKSYKNISKYLRDNSDTLYKEAKE